MMSLQILRLQASANAASMRDLEQRGVRKSLFEGTYFFLACGE